MADVIDLDAQRPHFASRCSCMTCTHEWVGVVPVGTAILECPKCRAMKGVAYSAREVRLIRALEKVATGNAFRENSRVNWDIARGIARDALAAESWGAKSTTQT